jgi:hypothetical protein
LPFLFLLDAKKMPWKWVFIEAKPKKPSHWTKEI